MSGSEIALLAGAAGFLLLSLFLRQIANADWLWMILSVLFGAFVGILVAAIFFVPYGSLWRERAIPSDVIGGAVGGCVVLYTLL